MTKTLLLALGMAIALSGCRVDRAPMDAAHAKRVDAINREASQDLDESNRRWATVEKQILEMKRYLIEVEPGTEAKPKNPVIEEYLPSFKACQGTPQAPAPDNVRSACEGAVRENFWRAFGVRYYRANLDWVQKEKEANPDADIEWLATKSHNDTINAEIEKSLAEIRRHKAEYRRMVQDNRMGRVQLSEQERDTEIEKADRKRRAVWAAALQGFSQGMQGASGSASGAGSQAYSGGGCTSDFSCGVGKKCVKQYYNSTGVCMQAVNEYGTPTYETPDANSVGPNMPSKSSCSIGTSCPVGFRCDFGSGVCVR
jgi:hypothetical protein